MSISNQSQSSSGIPGGTFPNCWSWLRGGETERPRETRIRTHHTRSPTRRLTTHVDDAETRPKSRIEKIENMENMHAIDYLLPDPRLRHMGKPLHLLLNDNGTST
jgi:hypothetical protein